MNASAAIVYSKLSLTGGIVNADVNASAAIDGSKIVSASVSVAGVVDTTTQSFIGAKTFTGNFATTATTTVGATGIVFNATPTLSAGATTLEGYKESSFTATISFGGANVGVTYAAGGQVSAYTRIGEFIHFAGEIVLTSKGSSTGSLRLNLPRAIGVVGSAGATVFGGQAVGYSFAATVLGGIVAVGNNGDSFVTLAYPVANGNTNITDATTQNNTIIIWSFSYKTADAF